MKDELLSRRGREKGKRKKKVSGDSSMDVYLSLGLACYSQPIVAGDFIDCRSRE
jgi:hypothetical protein